MQAGTVFLGEIVNTVGLKGEVKLLPSRDFWMEALSVSPLELVSPEGIRRNVLVDKFRAKRHVFVLKLSGIGTINEAESIIGSVLEVSLGVVDDSVFPKELKPFQVEGVDVYLSEGTHVGKVVDMLIGPQQDCLIVEKDGERYIVPNVPEVVRVIDLEKGVIEIDPPEGLLDLRW